MCFYSGVLSEAQSVDRNEWHCICLPWGELKAYINICEA